MKIVCVLISYILVTVLADEMEQYLKNFHFINLQMATSRKKDNGNDNELEREIKNTIAVDCVSMEQLNLLFGVSVELIIHNKQAAAELQSKFLSKFKSRPMLVPVDRTLELNLEKLAKTRRTITGEAIESILKKRQGESTAPTICTCRLIGLYKNTKLRSKEPSEYIKSVNFAVPDLCILTSTLDNSITFYRHADNKIAEVNPYNPKINIPLFGEPKVDLDTKKHIRSRKTSRVQFAEVAERRRLQNPEDLEVTQCHCSIQ